jgi:hypothetical protein
MGRRRASIGVDKGAKAGHHVLMSSTAELLQEHENRGYRWASALLTHAGDSPDQVLIAAHMVIWGNSVGAEARRTPSYWRVNTQKRNGSSCAFMAGVELAIEQHEAGAVA